MNRFLLCYSKSHVIVRDFVNTKKHSRIVKLQIIITRVTPITLHLDTITSSSRSGAQKLFVHYYLAKKK